MPEKKEDIVVKNRIQEIFNKVGWGPFAVGIIFFTSFAWMADRYFYILF